MEQAKKDQLDQFLTEHSQTKEVFGFLERAEEKAKHPGYARTLIELVRTKHSLHWMKDRGEITESDFEDRLRLVASLATIASLAYEVEGKQFREDLQYLEENILKLSEALDEAFPEVEDELAKEGKVVDIRSNEDRP